MIYRIYDKGPGQTGKGQPYAAFTRLEDALKFFQLHSRRSGCKRYLTLWDGRKLMLSKYGEVTDD